MNDALQTAAYDEMNKSLYLDGAGRRLTVEDKTFIVTIDGSEPIATIPQHHLGSVVCVGPVSLSAGARERLLTLGISTTFLTWNHRYLGNLVPTSLLDAERIVAHVKAVEDATFRIAIARQIVAGKLDNMKALLTRFNREDNIERIAALIERILTIKIGLPTIDSIPGLMGAEGAATAAYYEGWSDLLPDNVTFTTRERRPATDPTNSLLSLGGAVLTGLATAALAEARLIPSLGFLHSHDGARPSLALDLIEEFRAPVVEQLALELLRRGRLTPDDFESGDDGSLLLSRAGRATYFEALEVRLREEFTAHHLGRKLSYREALTEQAHLLARSITTNSAMYESVRWQT